MDSTDDQTPVEHGDAHDGADALATQEWLRSGQVAALFEPPRVYWRLRCFGFRIDYSVVLSH